jgi:two-component system, OmpR family, sensor histidine kinase TctE
MPQPVDPAQDRVPLSQPNPVRTLSLFGEILDWMLAPLLLLWPISIVATNHVANQIADLPYDRQLGDLVVAIVRQIDIDGARVKIDLPGPARNLLRADEVDKTYYQIIGSRGELLAGDREIPVLSYKSNEPLRDLLFRDASIHGEDVRVAYQWLPAGTDKHPVLIQIAETRHKREQLTSRIITGILLPQFAIIPLAVVLVWLGLTRGLAPLNRLQARIRQRRPDDLSPIHLRHVPDELRPMIAAFNDMMARLEDNLEAQHRFISAAAHQLKTPLTGLKTQTELALQEKDCTQLHDYLQRIAAGVDRASHLTYQLLQLARAEASHDSEQKKEQVDLDGLAREVTAHCVPRALARNIDLGFESAGGTLPIPGVPLLLREMLDNLVDNAIKYSPVGGHVTVRVRAQPHCVIEVEDDGIGIAKEDRARIFERFYRVLDTQTEGSGLGLAIVREIAELHHARITVLENPQGKGTLIRIIFPAAGEQEAAPPAVCDE